MKPNEMQPASSGYLLSPPRVGLFSELTVSGHGHPIVRVTGTITLTFALSLSLGLKFIIVVNLQLTTPNIRTFVGAQQWHEV